MQSKTKRRNHKPTQQEITNQVNIAIKEQVFWPPAKTQRGEMTVDADGHRYRRCTQCDVWFSRKTKSKCPCNTATYCSQECQKKNWRVHRLHCTERTPSTSNYSWGFPGSVFDMLPALDERGTRKVEVAMIMKSPDFEEHLRIKRAELHKRLGIMTSDSSSSSSSTSAPSTVLPCSDSQLYSEIWTLFKDGPLGPLPLQDGRRAHMLLQRKLLLQCFKAWIEYCAFWCFTENGHRVAHIAIWDGYGSPR